MERYELTPGQTMDDMWDIFESEGYCEIANVLRYSHSVGNSHYIWVRYQCNDESGLIRIVTE